MKQRNIMNKLKHNYTIHNHNKNAMDIYIKV